MQRPVTDRDKPADLGAADEDELERVAARVAGSQLRLALRGRAPEGWPPLPEESDPLTRIRYIVEVMRRGHWGGKRSVKALAATWGLTQSTVASDAVVASKHVRARLDELNVASLRAEIVCDLRRARRLALAVAATDPAKASKALVDVARAFADVTGAGVPRTVAARVEVSQQQGAAQTLPPWMVQDIEAEGDEVLGGDDE